MRVLALFLLLSVAVWAQPTLTPERPCYVFTSKVKFTGTGFPPETPVEIYTSYVGDGEKEPPFSSEGSITTGPKGIIEGEFPAPQSGNQGKAGTLILQARAGSVQATARVRIVPIAVTPEIVGYNDTNGSIDLQATGFIGFDNLYAHYILQQPGKPNRELHTVKVGPLDKATGGLRLKYKKFPFKPIPKGGYVIQFDGYEKYSSLTDSAPTPQKPYVLFNTSVP